MILEDFINCTFTTIAPKDIKLYAKCFWAEKDERLKNFIDNVSSDCNIDRAELDFSEESLEVLDRWLVKHVECVKLTKEEYEMKRDSFLIILILMIGDSAMILFQISLTLVCI